MQVISRLFIGAAMLSLMCAAQAKQPVAYPEKGQSAEKQSKDDAACYAWAKKSTGIDPAVVAQAPPQQETGPAVGGGERMRGAARGAVGGAAIGAIAGDTGKGAGAGAVIGTIRGGQRERANQAERTRQSQSSHQETIEIYYRAYGACMSGRGYTVQ